MPSTGVNSSHENKATAAYLATKKTATGLKKNKHILRIPQLTVTRPEANSKISGARGANIVELPSPR
jgi:hypothetical protein